MTNRLNLQNYLSFILGLFNNAFGLSDYIKQIQIVNYRLKQ
jgi:hypothetical protein